MTSFPPDTRSEDHTLATGIDMRVYRRGQGVPVLFLHGFPERALSWRAQLASLPEGYEGIAPDLRGYGDTSAPRGRWHYTVDALMADVRSLLDRLGHERVHLVGHDWGASLAWQLAMEHGERLRSLTILNGPPIPTILRHLFRYPDQLRSSWYFFLFQLPILPEWGIRRDPVSAIVGAFRANAGRKEHFTPETLRDYIEPARDGLSGGIDWYRGALLRPRLRLQSVTTPTRVIWGLQDKALQPRFAEADVYRGWTAQLDIVKVPEAGHWVQQEAPAAVNEALWEHVRRHEPAGA